MIGGIFVLDNPQWMARILRLCGELRVLSIRNDAAKTKVEGFGRDEWADDGPTYNGWIRHMRVRYIHGSKECAPQWLIEVASDN